jgi:hypothetical protein
MYQPDPSRMWMVYDQRYVGAFTTPLNLASFPVRECDALSLGPVTCRRRGCFLRTSCALPARSGWSSCEPYLIRRRLGRRCVACVLILSLFLSVCAQYDIQFGTVILESNSWNNQTMQMRPAVSCPLLCCTLCASLCLSFGAVCCDPRWVL